MVTLRHLIDDQRFKSRTMHLEQQTVEDLVQNLKPFEAKLITEHLDLKKSHTGTL